MPLRFRILCGAFAILGLTLVAGASRQAATEYGPAKGTLLIVGGNMARTSPLYDKFIQLAGGPDAKFVIVPTAGGNRNADGTLHVYNEETQIAPWLARGLKHVKM